MNALLIGGCVSAARMARSRSAMNTRVARAVLPRTPRVALELPVVLAARVGRIVGSQWRALARHRRIARSRTAAEDGRCAAPGVRQTRTTPRRARAVRHARAFQPRQPDS